MVNNMNLSELSVLIGSNIIDSSDQIKAFKTNSKEVKKNDVFIAINSGHDYLSKIKKCKAVVVENDFKSPLFPSLKVSDTKEALMNIAASKRKKYKGLVIAITGSNGKTTTKELLSFILKNKYNVFKTYKNMNNDIGVSINLLNLSKSDIAIFELGMNHKGELQKLSKLVKPNISIITNIGTAHIGSFGNKKNIYEAKMEILDGMDEKKLFVNGNDKYLQKCDYTKVTFDNDLFKINNIKEHQKYVEFDLFIDKKYHIKYHIPSKTQLTNVALAIYVSLYLNVKPKKIVKSLNRFKCVESRMEVIKKSNKIIINDSYNANYESLMSGLDSLKVYDKDKICIIGSILELGNKTAEIYRKISKNINNDYQYIFIDNEIKAKNATYFANVDELINYYNENKKLFQNKVIYIKGSHSVNLIKFVEKLKK